MLLPSNGNDWVCAGRPMRIKFCVSNLDLHAGPGDEKKWIEQMEGRLNASEQDQVEVEELHCLGYCYLCQNEPFALAENRCIIISKSEGDEADAKP